MSEGENHQGDEVWEEVPEPEEINEEGARASSPSTFSRKKRASLMSSLLRLWRSPAGRNVGRIGSSISGAPRSAVHSPTTPTFECLCFSSRTIFLLSVTPRSLGVRCVVMINSQKMRQLRATQRGMHLLLNHEAQGHCRGYGHGEANSQVNPAFSPRVLVNA